VPEKKRPFCIEVLTPEGSVCTAEAVSATFPASDGRVGVLAGHMPMVALLGAGAMEIQRTDGQEVSLYVSGGFAQFRENAFTILAEEAIPIEKIDAEEAWEDIERARKLPMDTEAAIARRERAIMAAQSKFKLAQKRRQGMKMPGASLE